MKANWRITEQCRSGPAPACMRSSPVWPPPGLLSSRLPGCVARLPRGCRRRRSRPNSQLDKGLRRPQLKFSSCVALITLISGLETGSLHESQLANHGTIRLRSCRSLNEIVTSFTASSISVYQVAQMNCFLIQGSQTKGPHDQLNQGLRQPAMI